MEQTTETTPTTESRPESMTAALAAVESPPVAETQPSESGDAATTAPPETPATEPGPGSAEDKAKGPIPFEVHQKALDNARTKEAERVRAEVEQQYAGMKDAIAWHQRLTADPVAAYLELGGALSGNPQYAAQLRSQAARTLAQARAGQPAPDPMPEPDLQTSDGTPVYSAPQQQKLREWDARQLTATLTKQFEERLSPFEQRAKTLQVQEERAAYDQSLTSVVAAMSKADPEFETYKKDVGALINADQRLLTLAIGDEHHAPDPQTAIEVAWGRVFRDKVLPTRLKKAETSALPNLQQLAVAASTNPAAATTATPKRPRSMNEALAQQGA